VGEFDLIARCFAPLAGPEGLGLQDDAALLPFAGTLVVAADAMVAGVHFRPDDPPDLVARIGAHRRQNGRYRLFFHDTHHRSVTAPEQMAAYDLDSYDGVLAFGAVIAEEYRRHGWARHAWVWHEAADLSLFRPIAADKAGDLVWIGNWGDEERTAELHEFLLRPIRALRLSAHIHGVRYPKQGIAAITAAGADYGGWLPNWRVPEVFARFRATIHVPRRPYAERLPGIPTIRVFEALACGIPLVSAPWDDAEHLFRPGQDFLYAKNGEEMTRRLRDVLHDADLAGALARSGLETIHARHSCAHRVSELIAICAALDGESMASGAAGREAAGSGAAGR
jgi:spore maturation protein CgeB